MQKLLKKFYLLTVLILTVCLAASCTMLSGFKKLSETGHASINGKKVNLKTMGDPEKDCLAFGYLKIPTEQLYIQSDPSTYLYNTFCIPGGLFRWKYLLFSTV